MHRRHLTAILAHFTTEGRLVSLQRNTEGHINDTFFSTFETQDAITRYTHQRINHFVFKNPPEVMANINLVTSHIQEKLALQYDDYSKRCLTIIPTRDGSLYYKDDDGNYWRTYRYIDGVKTIKTVQRPEEAYLLGQAVGTFQTQLADFDGSRLYPTIADFHNMRSRYELLEKAMKTNYQNRLSLVRDELEYLFDNQERGYVLTDGLLSGELPIRVTHNDTKISNVLFSEDGKEALCIIDLDTVMPGTILFDTGDMIRSATTTAVEDEKDLSLVHFDTALHGALLDGYFSNAPFLTERERALVVESGRNITQIMAVRFLTDYLNGDTYYHTEYESHNLVRARNQIAFMRDMDIKLF